MVSLRDSGFMASKPSNSRQAAGCEMIRTRIPGEYHMYLSLYDLLNCMSCSGTQSYPERLNRTWHPRMMSASHECYSPPVGKVTGEICDDFSLQRQTAVEKRTLRQAEAAA